MSGYLENSIDRLRESTARLNAISDETSFAVQAVETFLRKEISVGITAWVIVDKEVLDEKAGHIKYLMLGFDRHQGEYRILVSSGTNVDDYITKPWMECNRKTKLQTVEKLPELITEVTNQVDKQVEQAAGVSATANSVIRALNRKGAK